MADPDLARRQQAYGRLRALHYNGKLPHAILLTGLTGVGKKATAIRLAMAFNCRRLQSEGSAPSEDAAPEVCGVCPACRQITAGSHPDVISIEPSGGLIKIGQIRELLTTLAMKPFGNGWRVVLVTDGSAMNSSAANALLKVLEEPPDRTVLILMAVQADSILATIRSRCQEVRLAPLKAADIRERIVSETGLPETSAKVVAQLAQGSHARALEMAQPQWLRRRAGLLELISTLPELSPAGKLIWANLLVRDKTALTDFLYVAQSWLRDLMAAKSGAGEFMNADFREGITREAEKFSTAALRRCLNSLSETGKALRRTNPNRRLLMEAILLAWSPK